MKKYLIDTNVCIMILRGKYNALEILQQIKNKDCYLSEITVFELMCGNEIAKQKIVGYKDQRLQQFLDLFNIVGISDVLAIAAKEKARLQLAGTPLDDDFDLFIGCSSVANGMVMVTENQKDFKNIKGIQIENWVKRDC